jgi:hypothetical protein
LTKQPKVIQASSWWSKIIFNKERWKQIMHQIATMYIRSVQSEKSGRKFQETRKSRKFWSETSLVGSSNPLFTGWNQLGSVDRMLHCKLFQHSEGPYIFVEKKVYVWLDTYICKCASGKRGNVLILTSILISATATLKSKQFFCTKYIFKHSKNILSKKL